MPKLIDLAGQRFGRWLVGRRAERRADKTYWHCRCSCGAERLVEGINLRRGLSRSCGCLAREELAASKRGVGGARPMVDLTGQRFGRLVAIDREAVPGGNARWRCRCDCGREKRVTISNLRSGATRSCGCLVVEVSRTVHTKHGATRGRLATPEYNTWESIRQRCKLASAKRFADYGGRGIKVCARWDDAEHGFENFLEDMGPRPNGTSLDRHPNPDGDYEPSNCRWATATEQNRNKRNNRRVTAFGESLCLSEWTLRFGVPGQTIAARLSAGWAAERAVSTPSRGHRPRQNPLPCPPEYARPMVCATARCS